MDSTYTRSTRHPSSYIQVPIDEKSSSAFYSGSHGSAAAPTAVVAQASTTTLGNAGDPKTADIKSWSKGFERMQDERLDKQRYVMSGNKSEEVSKLALGAKLERALGRRMTGQDAVFTPKKNGRSTAGAAKNDYSVECR